ncbi:MAG: triphosphoribosyl-dephospho-CoA synthase [Burkholderiaceae bacterium]
MNAALATWRAAPTPVEGGAIRHVGRSAIAALYDELALEPKPGLVSFVDSGSHDDMDAATFMRSLFALRHYFAGIAAAGARQAAFTELERLGIDAERAMLRATGGVNTHRGAIFTLGLLCAAAGGLFARGVRVSPEALRAQLLTAWGAALRARCMRAGGSDRQRLARALGLRSAGEEAALGFPVLFDVTLPALQRATAQGLGGRRARLHALLQTVAVLDDTNLAHRGGLAGLSWARRSARYHLAGGSGPDALDRAWTLHAGFVARRLSPGGAADLLAAACWIERLRALS